jgi:hypothetical protein
LTHFQRECIKKEDIEELFPDLDWNNLTNSMNVLLARVEEHNEKIKKLHQ